MKNFITVTNFIRVIILLSLPFLPLSLLKLLFTNTLWQLTIFLFLAHLPAAFTGHMLYVDIAWPAGLVIIAVQALLVSDSLLSLALSVALLFHGGRMLIGSIWMFGQASQFSYRFKQDLPRYQYAQEKFIKSYPKEWWPWQMQWEITQQLISNLSVIPITIFMAVSHSTLKQSSEIGWIGLTLWLLGSIFENIADGQKMAFTKAVQDRPEAKNLVLGYPPYDGYAYYLWTICRHPNYFGEWVCWCGFALAAVGSIVGSGQSIMLIYPLALIRGFYVCLVYWTGSGPAEAFSVRRRPLYRKYQEATPCFVPFGILNPIIPSYQIAGWPNSVCPSNWELRDSN